MRIQTLTLSLFLATLLPLPAGAAGSIVVENTIAGVPLTIGVRGMPVGDYDLVVRPTGATAAGDIIVPLSVGAEGSADALLRADEVEIAGTYTVSLEQDGKALPSTARFDVAPGPLDTKQSQIEAWEDRIAANDGQEATVAVRALDSFGNPLSGRPVQLFSSRPSDSITASSNETDGNGQLLFSVSTTEGGAMYLRAMDMISGQMLEQSVMIHADTLGMGNDPGAPTKQSHGLAATISGGRTFYYAAQAAGPIIAKFRMTGPSRVKAGNPLPRVSVITLDDNDRRVVSYEGTIVCSSTDPEADLPDVYTYLGSEKGMHHFDVNFILHTIGPQEIKCEDSENPAIAGILRIEVQGSGGDRVVGGFRIEQPVSGGSIRELVVRVIGEGELVNYVVDGNFVVDAPVTLSSDTLGHFEGDVYLEPGQETYTLTIYNEQGGPPKTITLHFDDVAPEIASVTFSPEKPKGGGNALAVVETESGISVRIAFKGEHAGQPDLALEETSSDGFYDGTLKNLTAGNRQMDVIATDAAGNETTLRVALDVGGERLAVVQDLEAEVLKEKSGTVLLRWDPVEGATGYLVYNAEKEEIDERGTTVYFWEEPLETNQGSPGTPSTEAEIAGIPPGAERFFSVTAVRDNGSGDGVESFAKSNVVRVQMLGMTLEASPQNSSVALSWSGLPKGIQVNSFLLRYGPSPDDLQESRSIAGKAKSYQVRDLLPGIHYFFQLTPITVAGVTMDELAATDDTIVLGGKGFRPAPAEPIPYNVAQKAPTTPVHAGAPLEDTGLPSFMWYALLGLGTFGLLQWHRQRTLKRTMALLEQMGRMSAEF